MERLRNGYSRLLDSDRIMPCCSKACKLGTLYGLSVVFLGISILTLAGWEALYNNILTEELILTSTSRSYEMWKKTPIPMYAELYLFNWTNSQEVIDSNFEVKPHFEECGPYTYTEVHERVNMQWHDNGTITYQQKKTWHFVPELSKGSLNDSITNINVIATTVASAVRFKSTLIKMMVNSILNSLEHTLVVTKTAEELLFKGYNDSLLDIASKINVSFIDINIPFDKFGWFYDRNESETYDGTFNIYTGSTDLELLGIMDLWNHMPYTSYYESYCGLVNGTSGELWPPIKDYEKVSIFTTDLCSSIALTYDDDTTTLGVKGRKYIGNDFTFDNGTLYPEQACFSPGDAVPSGVRNVSECKFGAPAFVSFPHFYLADESFTEDITGMNPKKSEHEFYISLEPNTGIPLDVRAQIQINIYLQPISGFNMFRNVKTTFVPVLWFRQKATLSEDYASSLRTLLMVPSIATYGGYSVLGLGILLLAVGLFFTFKKHNKEENQNLIPENNSS